jgi:benzoyl-CoA reductase/2-hydroxyglutaryl-CoA dehydratase subunit BcrC/BadD/HgdB
MVTKEAQSIKASKKTIESTRMAWPLQKEDYAIGQQWKQEGKPVAWSCALFPKELYRGMDVFAFYPEEFAALFSVRRLGGSKDKSVPTYSVKFCQIAEAEGFKSYLCGYARTALGYVLNGLRTGDWIDVPLGGPALPDFFITTSLTCDVRQKWFEAMAEMLGVPLFCLDVPENLHDFNATGVSIQQPFLPDAANYHNGITPYFRVPTDYDLDYMVSQIEDCIAFMENVTGHKFNMEKFNETMEYSYRTTEVNRQIYELRKTIPAPMTSADGLAMSYPALYLSGTKRGYEFFNAVLDEVKDKVEHGIAAFPSEKYRLMWIGLPNWYNMGILNYFEPRGGVFVWETMAYNTGILPPRRPDDPIKELALRCFQQQYGTIAGPHGIGNSIANALDDARDYKIDGAVLSYLITCRPIVHRATELARALKEKLGIPSVDLESDLVDERIFAESQAFTRLDAFLEQLIAKGPIAHGGDK